MPTAHMIYGYSAWARRLLPGIWNARHGAVRFSNDEWMTRLYGQDPPIELFATYKQNVWDLLQGTWTRCLSLGIDVVLDFGFWARAERDSVRSLVAACGANHRLYELTCPDDEAWKRVEARNNNLEGAFLITRNTFEFLKNRFEPLGDDEERSVPAFNLEHGAAGNP